MDFTTNIITLLNPTETNENEILRLKNEILHRKNELENEQLCQVENIIDNIIDKIENEEQKEKFEIKKKMKIMNMIKIVTCLWILIIEYRQFGNDIMINMKVEYISVIMKPNMWTIKAKINSIFSLLLNRFISLISIC
ncbi:unnamed protein product [Rotaria sordida]|uniref:Uncharacterized protein n=1 Tax=Rotaria sordida TaxID=392033 RepID=A0A814ZAX0_9BILA|nr:unnamed protein product [Rotaria sordida]